MKEESSSIATDWHRLTAGIRDGDSRAIEALYESFRWLKSYFASQLGAHEAEDRYHDLIIAVVTGIRRGALREPGRLAGYAKATAANLVAERIRVAARQRETPVLPWDITDSSPNAEIQAVSNEVKAIAASVLNALSQRDCSVLTRFYILEDEPRQIQRDLGITEEQFRLIKSRAKARFEMLMTNRLKSRRR